MRLTRRGKISVTVLVVALVIVTYKVYNDSLNACLNHGHSYNYCISQQ